MVQMGQNEIVAISILYIPPQGQSMNKVSPIVEEDINSSAGSFHHKIEIRYHPARLSGSYTGPLTCRICLEEEQPNTPPLDDSEEAKEMQLIIPCECRGSVSYVHQKCIKMWIQKQLSTGNSKRAYCEICKSEVFFKKIKIRYCDCRLSNVCETSPCNIVCLIAEIILIGIIALVQYYVDHLMNFSMLRNTLLGLLALLCATFLLTLVLILKEMFVRTYKEIEKIYSLAESEQLGFREPRCRLSASASHTEQGIKKRRNHHSKKESQRPMNPYGSIGPELMVVFN